MSIVRVGTTKKYADGWDRIFGETGTKTKKRSSSKPKAKAATKKKAKKK